MTRGLGQLGRARRVRYVQGRGHFTGANTLRVSNASELTDVQFDYAVIATGSRPSVPAPLQLDSPRLWDSTRALEIPEVPASLLIVGGGYIGLELGSVYQALGSRVTIVEMTGGLLPGTDRDLVAPVARSARRARGADPPEHDRRRPRGARHGDCGDTVRQPKPRSRNASSIACWWPSDGGPTPKSSASNRWR